MDLIDLSALSWSDYFDYRHDIRVDRERTFRCYTCLPDKLPCPPPLPLKAGMQPKTLEKEVEISSVSSTFIRRLIAEKHSSFFVFLHGGGHSSLTWAMVAKIMKQHHPLLCIDLRAHGGTHTSDEGDLSVETLRDDIVSLLGILASKYSQSLPHSSSSSASSLPTPPSPAPLPERNSRELSIILVGHSLGGALAIRVARAISQLQPNQTETRGGEPSHPQPQSQGPQPQLRRTADAGSIVPLVSTTFTTPKQNTHAASFAAAAAAAAAVSSSSSSSISAEAVAVAGVLSSSSSYTSTYSPTQATVKVRGVCVLDVVEGTALEALEHMSMVVKRRPTRFDSVEAAVKWALMSQQVRNIESARVSIPDQLTCKKQYPHHYQHPHPHPHPHQHQHQHQHQHERRHQPIHGRQEKGGSISPRKKKERTMGNLNSSGTISMHAHTNRNQSSDPMPPPPPPSLSGASNATSIGHTGVSQITGAKKIRLTDSGVRGQEPGRDALFRDSAYQNGDDNCNMGKVDKNTCTRDNDSRRSNCTTAGGRRDNAHEPEATEKERPPELSSDRKAEEKRGKWRWKTDLLASRPYWRGWFEGLSATFLGLSFSIPKLLVLASTDRLDTALTIAQMQGKFQMRVMASVGHTIQEDAPKETARLLLQFAVRNGFGKSLDDGRRRAARHQMGNSKGKGGSGTGKGMAMPRYSARSHR